MNDIILEIDYNLPARIGAYVRQDCDPSTGEIYHIVISGRLSPEKQQEKFIHEKLHLQYSDFEKESVQEIEAEAHKRHSQLALDEYITGVINYGEDY